MDHELLESISKALKKLQQEQTVLSNKLIKIAEVCKNKFAKVEREQAEKHLSYEKKLEVLENKGVERYASIDDKVDHLSCDIEELKKDEVKLSDDVSIIEAERKQVTETISIIDDTLSEIKVQINAFEKHIHENKLKQEENNSRKTCRFNNKGYCTEQERCQFFHADKDCEIYKRTGVCWKIGCRLRHPKTCWYGERCFRGESCGYLHHTVSCDRCEQKSQTRYYCEFCEKSFCERCTNQKAHIENIYGTEQNKNPNCDNLHYPSMS